MSIQPEIFNEYNWNYFEYEGNFSAKINNKESFQEWNSQFDYSGLLLRVEDKEGHFGYANYHALHAFGDLKASQFLEDIRGQNISYKQQHIFTYLLQDLQNRRMGVDALTGAFVIENHKLLTQPLLSNEKDLLNYIKQGFKTFKIKMGSSIEQETLWLKEHSKLFLKNHVKLRLDFNECLTEESFTDWHNQHEFLSSDLIDYYEDPTKFEPKSWKKWKDKGLTLALDVADSGAKIDSESLAVTISIMHSSGLASGSSDNLLEGSSNTDYSGVRVFVLKPARFNIIEWLKKLPQPKNYDFVVSHYMDTPLGLTTAVSSALKLKFFVKDRLKTCGLLPFETGLLKEFFPKPMLSSGAHLIPKEDKGYGWTEELTHVPWKSL